MKLRLRRADRDVEQRRDFVVAVALDVVEHEHVPSAARKPRYRGLEVDPRVAPRGVVSRRSGLGRRGVVLDRGATTAFAIENHVESEAMQPRRERRLPSICRELLPRAHEDFLRRFVGVSVAKDSSRERVHARSERPVHALERARVAARGERDVGLDVGDPIHSQRWTTHLRRRVGIGNRLRDSFAPSGDKDGAQGWDGNSTPRRAGYSSARRRRGGAQGSRVLLATAGHRIGIGAEPDGRLRVFGRRIDNRSSAHEPSAITLEIGRRAEPLA